MTAMAPTGGLVSLDDDSTGSCADGICRIPTAIETSKGARSDTGDSEDKAPPTAVDDIKVQRSGATSRPKSKAVPCVSS